MNTNQTRFWETKSLEEMNQEEWESLCDGCARCCLLKLEDEDTREVFFTNVVCRYLDQAQCRCTEYADRNRLVPDCVLVTPEIARQHWLPDTCAYRLLAEGKPLPDWHPLVSGDRDSVFAAGIAVRDKVVSEEYVHPDELVEHLIHWHEDELAMGPGDDDP